MPVGNRVPRWMASLCALDALSNIGELPLQLLRRRGMRICDRCGRSDRRINMREVVIYTTVQELCSDCQKELEKIFLEFIKKGGGEDAE